MLFSFFFNQMKDITNDSDSTSIEQYPLPVYTDDFDPYAQLSRRSRQVTKLDEYCLKVLIASSIRANIAVVGMIAAAAAALESFNLQPSNGPGTAVIVETPTLSTWLD